MRIRPNTNTKLLKYADDLENTLNKEISPINKIKIFGILLLGMLFIILSLISKTHKPTDFTQICGTIDKVDFSNNVKCGYTTYFNLKGNSTRYISNFIDKSNYKLYLPPSYVCFYIDKSEIRLNPIAYGFEANNKIILSLNNELKKESLVVIFVAPIFGTILILTFFLIIGLIAKKNKQQK